MEMGSVIVEKEKKVLPMAEYIDREALYEKAYWHGEHPDVGNPFPDGVDAIDIKDVDAIPASDVAPVVHGQWEPGNPICPVCGGNKFKDLDADIWCDWQPDFCPNCGAKMNGSKA